MDQRIVRRPNCVLKWIFRGHFKPPLNQGQLQEWTEHSHTVKKSLSPFRGPQGQEAIFEVAEAKFWISSIFNDLKRGSGIFFKNYIFEISAFQQKDEVCHSFLVKLFTKSLHRGGVDVLWGQPIRLI